MDITGTARVLGRIAGRTLYAGIERNALAIILATIALVVAAIALGRIYESHFIEEERVFRSDTARVVESTRWRLGTRDFGVEYVIVERSVLVGDRWHESLRSGLRIHFLTSFAPGMDLDLPVVDTSRDPETSGSGDPSGIPSDPEWFVECTDGRRRCV